MPYFSFIYPTVYKKVSVSAKKEMTDYIKTRYLCTRKLFIKAY